MNFSDLQKTARTLYYPVFLLEKWLSHARRKKILSGLKAATGILFLISVMLFFGQKILTGQTSLSFGFVPKVYGIFDIVLFFWAIFFCLEAFYYSYYYAETDSKDAFIDFDLAYIIERLDPQDITESFFSTAIGQLILLRCGIHDADFNTFLKQRKSRPAIGTFKVTAEDGYITVWSFLQGLCMYDVELSRFLFSYGIQKKEMKGIAEWITEVEQVQSAKERWWSKENLSRIPGIGQGWSYGRAFTLEKYKKPLPYVRVSGHEIHSSYGAAELKELESVLSRRREGNALLVGNDKEIQLEIVSRLSSLIEQDAVPGPLKNKYVVLLDNDGLVATNGSKVKFEKEFITLMREAVAAGNIILIIGNLASFVTETAGIGVDIVSLVEPYLSSPSLQIIGLSDTARFHSVLEKNQPIMQNFETILIQEVDESNTIKVLENEIIRFENQGFFFTYPALLAIGESAQRYFPDGVMPDKAVDLLSELVPKLQSQNKMLVEKQDVLALVETKTGIPVGVIKPEEKNKLLHLEDILHERIVGQDEAITAISSAVRRARSGITNPNRPIGSFLFLGPTGVGKTETTKALSQVFFGTDTNVMRLDMSEYSSFDAVSKLIGSFEKNQEGVLSSLLREHQYGVLLLDEFEKTTKEVMNIFLQILDEGFFSDMSGKKVGARNLIIIATSNAGSELIWETIKSGSDLSQSKDIIVDSIVKAGIFSPELLNRFDGVILFHPLTDPDLRTIAQLMLNKLHERLSERGIDLVVDDLLVNFVVQYGTDPKFGARPMNRAIQEKVEQIVANKIISGEAVAGQPLTLTEKDLVL